MADIKSSRRPAARSRRKAASQLAQVAKLAATNRNRLLQVIRGLEHVRSAAIISTQVLEHQNAEQDRDIASVLDCCVNNRLEAEILNLRRLFRAPGNPC